MKSPRAAAVMHTFVARMGHQNAVVISQKLLAKLIGCNERTIRRAIEDLERDRWIQVVQIGPSGTVNAYVVNDNVAWGQKRDQKVSVSIFSAAIVADADDQADFTLEARQLRRVAGRHPRWAVQVDHQVHLLADGFAQRGFEPQLA